METLKSQIPALFIGHGSPMNIIADSPYIKQWEQYFVAMDKNPEAIVAISAHWVTNGIGVTQAENPQQIYDFYGFPQELYDIKLNLKGDPELAKYLKYLTEDEAILTSEWGIDHGTWTILYRALADQNIPVVQLSINYPFSFEQHFELAKKLRVLREKNVLILGSGNIVHNLRHSQPLSYVKNQSPHEWAQVFLNKVIDYINQKDSSGLLNYLQSGAKEIDLSIASKEHFIPLLYVLAQYQDGDCIDISNYQFDMTALDMTCVAIRTNPKA